MPTKPQVKFFDIATGEEIIRDANAEELAQMAKDNAEFAAKIQELQEKAAAKQAVLDRLGLTEDEAKLLLG
jgi:hypothetical protein